MTIHFENKKKEIEVIIQEKKKKKQESMTLRLKEKEQKKTATMVARQSREMLEVLAQKQEELKQELKQELAADHVSFFIDTLGNSQYFMAVRGRKLNIGELLVFPFDAWYWKLVLVYTKHLVAGNSVKMSRPL